jgi:endonuclease/exonuclease/phosphatase family metal-dependent hydrolase
VTLRLATWNLHGSAEPDLGTLADLIKQFDLDIIAGQELRRHQARHLAHRLDWSHTFWTFKHNGWYGLPRRSEGLGLLSRVPANERLHITLSVGAPWWNYTRRIAQRATVGELVVVNAHLASHNDVAGRTRQVERLIEFADGADVLAGDFNDTPGGIALARLAEVGWHDVFDLADETVGTGNTSPVDNPIRRIDHVLVRESVAVLRVEVPTTNPTMVSVSDHLPVIADLARTS